MAWAGAGQSRHVKDRSGRIVLARGKRTVKSLLTGYFIHQWKTCIAKSSDNLQRPQHYWNVQTLHRSKNITSFTHRNTDN